MRYCSGMTLMEALTVIAIMGVLAALAAPGFSTLRQNAQRTAAVNNYFHALFLARSEAIKRGKVVSLCRSLDGERCANSAPEWTQGWLVFANTNRDEPPQRDARESVIARYPAWEGGRITSNRVAFSFRPYNRGAVNGTILFCDGRGAAHSRAIIISHTGRPRISQRDANNKPLRCPRTKAMM